MATHIIVIVGDVAERRRALAGGEAGIEGMEAGEMIDRPDPGQRQQIRLEVPEIVVPLPLEDVIGDPVGRVQRAPVDRPQCRKLLLGSAPLISAWAWNSLRSNRRPSARSASARSLRKVSWPIL